jgi:D-alanine-D-alanine ligase
MREDGSVFVLEANANPNLTYGEDFAESAEVAGIGYEQLLNRIVQLGLNYRPEWRMFE